LDETCKLGSFDVPVFFEGEGGHDQCVLPAFYLFIILSYLKLIFI
jgi:hypothetical protein